MDEVCTAWPLICALSIVGRSIQFTNQTMSGINKKRRLSCGAEEKPTDIVLAVMPHGDPYESLEV